MLHGERRYGYVLDIRHGPVLLLLARPGPDLSWGMGEERLDFQRIKGLCVNVRNAMIYNKMNPSKGGNSMSETLHDAAQAYLEHLRGQ